jgi:hypothetical protein
MIWLVDSESADTGMGGVPELYCPGGNAGAAQCAGGSHFSKGTSHIEMHAGACGTVGSPPAASKCVSAS